MKLKPVANRVLIQFHFPPEDGVILPESQLNASFEEKRTKVECLVVGELVTVCKPGDFLYLHDDAKRVMVPTSKEPAQALIHDGVILAVVTDDKPYDLCPPIQTSTNSTISC